ncbi:MAG TPA: rod shape-determining protein RodA [candidate division WOR-3 bacterium]|uniref:Rod shape-determining protein RodA n=1 Tax=candidate division WOR-3 bacterium TaxID=2052148 RepID=A0A7C5HJ04_UNCW3|nr:rod shape-determining protein RodA [Candidatus Aminicenantes bacterium]HHE04429.1 rod shape-determining protein RodA [candidate division WOR-3 bacterium]
MRRISEIDFGILITAISITGMGLAGIWAARGGFSSYFSRQVLWLFIGIIAFFVFALIDYEKLVSWSAWFYAGLIIILLILARGRGISSWFKFGSVWIQPSELGKLIVPLFLTRILYKKASFPLSLNDLVKIGAVVGLPSVLIAIQPDLGTAFVYSAFIFAPLLIYGIKRTHLNIALLFLAVFTIFMWFFFLKDYQKERITSFLNPSDEPRGSGYQVYQSKISIGSGRLMGKGLKEVSQARLKFLPAAHTDFIFSVIAESFGFLGILVLLFLYLILFTRIYRIGDFLDSEKAFLLLLLTSSWIAFQTVFNLLITLGLFPVTGFPLPFMSYGGSDLITAYSSLGIINSVKAWRWK